MSHDTHTILGPRTPQGPGVGDMFFCHRSEECLILSSTATACATPHLQAELAAQAHLVVLHVMPLASSVHYPLSAPHQTAVLPSRASEPGTARVLELALLQLLRNASHNHPLSHPHSLVQQLLSPPRRQRRACQSAPCASSASHSPQRCLAPSQQLCGLDPPQPEPSLHPRSCETAGHNRPGT